MTAARCLLSFIAVLLSVPAAGAETAGTPPAGMVLVPGGDYKPLYAKEAKRRNAPACFLGVTPVTNGQFLAFVKQYPKWQRSKVTRDVADENYLRHWAGDLDIGPGADAENAPVTHVSWFAARAYCAAQGRRLPTQDEWEFAARADATRIDATSDQAFLRKLLEWYAKPNTGHFPPVEQTDANVYGLRGLHGLVWEWVDDFNSTMIAGDSRSDDSLERRLFCGSASLLASDVSNYAAFMRYAFRASLKGNYCVGSLGFRTAMSIDGQSAGPSAAGSDAASPYGVAGTWRSQGDQKLTLHDLKGKVRVLTMGFTSCQYACPRIVGDLQRIESALGADAVRVGFVFVSIDPVRDTPEKMATFAAERKLDPARWTFLSGTPESVRSLSVALAYKYQQVEQDFAHSNLIAVIDAAGAVVHREEALGAEIGPTVEAVRKLLAGP
jgi:formylglycine-generating enzyme